VRFEVSNKPARTLRQVFDEYTVDFEFMKTRIIVKLFTRGDRFMSRSEARRVTTGLERFREVVLDFRGVVEVGQGFVTRFSRLGCLTSEHQAHGGESHRGGPVHGQPGARTAPAR